MQSKDDGSAKPEPVAIIHHADVRRMLMTMRAQIEAMRALAYYTAAAHRRRAASIPTGDGAHDAATASTC